MSRPMQLTRELVVQPAVYGRDVFYKIFQTENDKEPVKVTRYSELNALQKALKREKPDFRATFPAKTLRRQTSPEFVESRRRDIEAYLQLCVANEYVVSADAWRIFMSDAAFRAAPDSNARASASGTSVFQTVVPPVVSAEQISLDDHYDLACGRPCGRACDDAFLNRRDRAFWQIWDEEPLTTEEIGAETARRDALVVLPSHQRQVDALAALLDFVVKNVRETRTELQERGMCEHEAIPWARGPVPYLGTREGGVDFWTFRL